MLLRVAATGKCQNIRPDTNGMLISQKDQGGLPDIRDKGLLISAVEMPRASMHGKYLRKTMVMVYNKRSDYDTHPVIKIFTKKQ